MSDIAAVLIVMMLVFALLTLIFGRHEPERKPDAVYYEYRKDKRKE